jgi:hypothetical protein
MADPIRVGQIVCPFVWTTQRLKSRRAGRWGRKRFAVLADITVAVKVSG